MMENDAPPQLVFFHGKQLENQVLVDVSGGNTARNSGGNTARNAGELAYRQIFKPTNLPDWLVLKVTDHLIIRILRGFFLRLKGENLKEEPPKMSPTRIQLCLWNPVTLQSIDLPVIEYEFGLNECLRHVLVTSNPSHPDCLVLVFLNKSILFWDVNGGERSWTRVHFPDNFFQHEFLHQGFEFALVKDSNHVFVRTRLRSTYPIAIIDVVMKPEKRLIIRPQEQWVTPHPRTTLAPGTNKTHWGVCNGDIFVVDVCKETLGGEVVGVTIFKMEHTLHNMGYSWSVLRTCPSVSFFIAHDQVLCLRMSKAAEGNKVYMVFGNERVLYTYHIEKKTMSHYLLPNDLPDCASRPYWILGLASAPPPANPNQGIYANRENKNAIGINYLNNIPLEVLKEYVIKNPIDYLNFRATNKWCRLVGSAKDWRNISKSPLLMIPLVDNGNSFLVDPISGSKYSLKKGWDYEFSSICSSSDGWLLMYNGESRDGTVKLRLYNPMTKSMVSLPDLVGYSSVFISNCRVIEIPMPTPAQRMSRSRFIDLTRKDSNNNYTWIDGGEVQAINVNQSNINPACLDGKDYYYLVGDHGDLASYVYNQDMITLRCLKLQPHCSFFEQRFIVAGYGKDIILSIYIGKEWKWLRIFEFSRAKTVMEWVEVEDLHNHNIYLSRMSCICKKVAFPAKGNKIYLTRFHGGRIVYYSLDERKFQAGEGDSSVVVSYYESEEQLYSCWFEPSLDPKF